MRVCFEEWAVIMKDNHELVHGDSELVVSSEFIRNRILF